MTEFKDDPDYFPGTMTTFSGTPSEIAIKRAVKRVNDEADRAVAEAKRRRDEIDEDNTPYVSVGYEPRLDDPSPSPDDEAKRQAVLADEERNAFRALVDTANDREANTYDYDFDAEVAAHAERYFDKKHDKGKSRFSLVPLGGLHHVADIAEFGAAKYEEDSWKTVPNARTRYAEAFNRHAIACMVNGPWALDEDSGLLHMAHAVWNGLAVLMLGKEDA